MGRAIGETDSNGDLKLYSRSHNDFTKRFPPIADALRELKKQAIFDGEICALDNNGFPRFEWLVNRGRQKGTLVYYIFDLLKLGDVDLRGEPLRKRKRLLTRFLGNHQRLIYVDHMEREGLAMFAGALALGLEGIVAKDAASPYIEGPRETSYWLKIKDQNYERQEKIEFHPRKKHALAFEK
jgi:bifunctional non-homologous end joining protein LigD